jgi:hypothetical protein
MFKKVEDLIRPCYKCKKKINIKYIYPKRVYSNKNSWEWWTEDKKNRGKYICDDCLSELFHKRKVEYLESVKNQTKRNTMRNYMWKIRGEERDK